MVVKLTQDTRELAEKYDAVSDSQYQNGCVLLDKIGIPNGGSVLDIGCGTGRLGYHVAEMIGVTGRYTGIDPLEDRIVVALRNNTYSNTDFRCGTAEDLSFAGAETYDAVYLNWVFHWIADKESVLQEIFRVLKKNGKIGITLPSKELRSIVEMNQVTDAVLSRKKYRQLVRIEESPQKQYNVTTTELIGLLTRAGFIVRDVQIQWSQRTFPTAQAVIDFMEASYFGNYLNHVPATMREQAKTDIKEEFEKYDTPQGLLLSYYPLYVVAQKCTAR